MSRKVVVASSIAAGGAVLACYLWRRHTRRAAKLQGAKGNCNIYLIRHGESTVNARGWQYRQEGNANPGQAYHEAEFLDAALTQAGRDEASRDVQCKLRAAMQPSRGQRIQRLVITSTLQRALETAFFGVFPLFPPDQQTKWVALESVREAVTCEIRSVDGVDVSKDVFDEKPCNVRRTLMHARKEFPHVDFSNCAEEDPLPRIENVEMVDKRVFEFVEWLREWCTRQHENHPNTDIDVVLVSHYVFLHRLMSKIERNTGGPIKPCGFKNCEMRVLPLSSILQVNR